MKKVVLSLVALSALMSCVQNEVTEPTQSRKVSLVAHANQAKTTLNGDAVHWENGDAVSLCFKSDADIYTQVFTTAGSGASAKFTGTIANEVTVANGYAETGCAVYPSTAMATDGDVEFTLQSQVVAKENGSFASGTNLSSAVVSLADLSEDGSADASFKNAFSIIRFTLDGNVTSLQVTADNYLSGAADFELQEDGRLAVSTWTSGAKYLYVTPENDTFTAGKTYNVLVYPGEFTSLSVFLTDASGCTYEKTITGEFTFAASEYYTFTFNTQFAKGYWFIGKGYSFVADVDKIMTVYTSNDVVLHEEVLTAQAGNKFEGNLPESVVTGENVKGFAVYPSTAYNAATDKISYTLPNHVNASTTLDKLYTAYLYVGIEEAQFTSITSALSKLKFDLPANIYSVKVESTTNIVGTAEVTVNAAGKPVVGMGSSKTVTVNPNGEAGVYEVYVFSLAGADLTITYADGAGKEIVDTNPGLPSEGEDEPVVLPEFKFDRDGMFTNEAFTDGGEYEF